MTTPFIFPPYENDQNYPTWALRQHVQSGSENIRLLAKFLAREGKLQAHFTLKMQGFFSTTSQDKFREDLMKDWISCAIQWVDWFAVLDFFQSTEFDREPNTLDMLAIECLKEDWQDIVIAGKEKDPVEQPDDALRLYMLNCLALWISSPHTRSHTESPNAVFIRGCFDLVIASVDWSRLTESFQEY
jgi:hypothetical protein